MSKKCPLCNGTKIIRNALDTANVCETCFIDVDKTEVLNIPISCCLDCDALTFEQNSHSTISMPSISLCGGLNRFAGKMHFGEDLLTIPEDCPKRNINFELLRKNRLKLLEKIYPYRKTVE